jgi:hypothetical protein
MIRDLKERVLRPGMSQVSVKAILGVPDRVLLPGEVFCGASRSSLLWYYDLGIWTEDWDCAYFVVEFDLQGVYWRCSEFYN